MVQEITRDFLAEKSIQYAEQKDSGAWANDCEGFIAGAMFVMQLLKQANVSGQSEQLPTFNVDEFERWMSGWVDRKHIKTIAAYVRNQLGGNCH